ncbi:uncharacterized protein LOC130297740 isoform X2 [Hyla sarda]|uniref:uncharacterized protein LOC130297740 isoform X2 n=1 Tax=Hyla sarda TaxID=327740 RepID=UPI0024C2F318|nr:uncharacterized protein LOC130297740 isoform X2 [Hyla sarda]
MAGSYCYGCGKTVPFSKSAQAPRQSKVLEKGKKLVVKNVNVKEYDDKFVEIAELYNNQVENYMAVKKYLFELNEVNDSANLTSCMEKIKEKYSSYDIQTQMKGYNFSLQIKATEDIPENLQKCQELIKELSRATKVLIGSQTKLGGMVFSFSQIQEEMADKIKEVNTGYLDQIRLVENLEENMKNIDKAKLFSTEYEQEASEVLREIAHIAGVTV